jgi:hypothetical protein
MSTRDAKFIFLMGCCHARGISALISYINKNIGIILNRMRRLAQSRSVLS